MLLTELVEIEFLSTPSARRATVSATSGEQTRSISIHALCEEGDDFFPRILLASGSFLSTPSARRATVVDGDRPWDVSISIHALCEEGDNETRDTHLHPDQFLSPPSTRRATDLQQSQPRNCAISIHALCEEGDGVQQSCPLVGGISIHALCEEGDPTRRPSGSRTGYFYPRPLRGGRHPSLGKAIEQAQFLSTPSARRATSAPWIA